MIIQPPAATESVSSFISAAFSSGWLEFRHVALASGLLDLICDFALFYCYNLRPECRIRTSGAQGFASSSSGSTEALHAES